MASATQEWVPFAQTFEKGFKFPDVNGKIVSSKSQTKFQTRVHKTYPISDQNGSKTIPFGAAHTYIADNQLIPQNVSIIAAVILGRHGGLMWEINA